MNDKLVVGFVGYFICLLIASLFNGYKAALGELTEALIKEKEEAGYRHIAFLKKQIGNTKRFASLVSIVNACIYVYMGAFAAWAFFHMHEIAPELANLENDLLQKIIILAVEVMLLLFTEVVGVVIPTRIGVRNMEKIVFDNATEIKLFSLPFIPLSMLVNGMAWLGLKLFGMDLHSDENVTEEEIISIVNEGHEQGVLEASEAEMISNIFEFSGTYAKEIMTHRTNIVSLDGTITLEQAMDIMLKGSFSRYPVYVEDADDVIGILYFRDVVAASQMPRYKKMAITEIPGLLRETMFIPETKIVNLLFQEMQKQKIHMATVIDEYGQIAGIVTMEDIIEEIVGNIQDEYDEEEEVIEEKEDGSFLIDGLAPMTEVVDMLGDEFAELEFGTLNGFLIALLDRFPEKGELPELMWKHYKFQVLQVEGRVIRQVRVTEEEVKEEEKTVEENTKK